METGTIIAAALFLFALANCVLLPLWYARHSVRVKVEGLPLSIRSVTAIVNAYQGVNAAEAEDKLRQAGEHAATARKALLERRMKHADTAADACVQALREARLITETNNDDDDDDDGWSLNLLADGARDWTKLEIVDRFVDGYELADGEHVVTLTPAEDFMPFAPPGEIVVLRAGDRVVVRFFTAPELYVEEDEAIAQAILHDDTRDWSRIQVVEEFIDGHQLQPGEYMITLTPKEDPFPMSAPGEIYALHAGARLVVRITAPSAGTD